MVKILTHEEVDLMIGVISFTLVQLDCHANGIPNVTKEYTSQVSLAAANVLADYCSTENLMVLNDDGIPVTLVKD